MKTVDENAEGTRQFDAGDLYYEDAALDSSRPAPRQNEAVGFSQWWLVAACVCLLAAVCLWLLGHADAAFVTAALGVLAWFLNVRSQLRQKNSHRDTETQRQE